MSITRAHNRLYRAGGIILALALLLSGNLSSSAQSNSRTFPETGQTVSGLFLDYWSNHGGLAQQGYPISGEIQEKSDLNGQTYTVQYFERAVFENHPENAGTPYAVLLSQLGTYQYRQKYPQGAPSQQADTTNPEKFPETGFTIGGRFRQYWEQNGGLAQQGYPISNEFMEKSDLNGQTYLVQYFERAVFELHPENTAPYDVLLSQLGTFQYRAKYQGGGQTTTPPTAAPTTAPAPPQGNGTLPRYGVDFVTGGNTKNSSEMATLGLGMVRMYVSWNQIEPTNSDPSAFKWTALDARFKALADAGLQPIMAFGDCPKWACPDPNGPLSNAPVSSIAQVVTAIAQRYSVAPYNFHLWEFWNEPDSTYGDNHVNGWGQHGDIYAQMLAVATPAVKAVDPAAQVALGGLGYDFFQDGNPPGPFNRQFLRDVVNAGGAQNFDYMNFHYYPQQPYYSNIGQKADAIKTLMGQLNLNKPIIVTETSMTSDPNPTFQHPQWGPSSTTLQSRYLAQTYVQAFAAGIRSVTWYTIQDTTSNNPGLGIFDKTGLLTQDGSRKPVFSAYHNLVTTVGDKPFLRKLSASELGPSDAEGYAFGDSSSEVWVIWSTSGASINAQLTSSRSVSAVTDMYGAAKSPSKTISVNGEPVYVVLK